MLVAALPNQFLDDLTLGLIIAALLPFLSGRAKATRTSVASVAVFGAEMSYSLYLFHFPIIVALAGLLVLPGRLPPSPEAFAVFAGLVVTALGLSAGLWFVFERNTPLAYRVAVLWLGGSASRASRGLSPRSARFRLDPSVRPKRARTPRA